MDSLAAALDKMRAAGAHPAELAAMTRRVEQLDDPDAGRLPGDVLEPLEDLPLLDELPEPSPERAREVLDALAVVKLNGGLGTSMGLSGPKSLLEVKPGASFLDVIATQVLALRERHGARLPLVVMNSAVDAGAVAGGAAPLRGPARAGGAAGVPAGPRAEAARGRPAARAVAGEPGPGVVPARARRPLHRAGRHRDARHPARRGAALGVRVELGQPRRARRRPGRRLGGRRGGARSPWRRCAAPRPTARAATSPAAATGPDGAARDRAGARRRPVLRRRRPLALLQHEQPVGGPAGATRPAGRRPRRPGAPADRQPQDRRPPRQVQHPGHPAGDGDGRGRRLDPGCAGGAGSALAVRAGEDDERPARGAFRRLRADARTGG